ncbi:hypothetical protein PHET_08185 [Paragonimus heterotremus]|uniref:RING-type domain-containing protein n=1 Tax=Paragonimus heterotremus TaxID=100268 RepID=A0A8J4SLR7_9TREM|nr:hypothetical protein PHET_08185 [Paragonimus heterotremus]
MNVLRDELMGRHVSSLKKELSHLGVDCSHCIEKAELVDLLIPHLNTFRRKSDDAWYVKSPTLNDLADEFAVDSLTVPQLKRLLADHNVTYSGLREKSEFVEEVKRLWRTHRHLSNSANCEKACCVCLNAVPDCALDPCGHVAMCYECAVGLTDCPVCRRHVQRVLRIYFAV